MPTLYFSKKYEDLVKQLCGKGVSPELNEIFENYRDLMLFAAMVGRRSGRKGERKGNGGEVESNYFKSANFNKEGVVYLMGLLETGSPEVLKGGAPECWKLFESYCDGGMEVISEWLSAAEAPSEYVTVLQTRIGDLARKAKKVEVTVKKPKLQKLS